MWLIELFKAKDGAAIGEGGVFSTNECNRDTNYINPDDYTHELNLCDNWDYTTKRKILVFKKTLEGIVIGPLQNERLMSYYYSTWTLRSIHQTNIIYLEHKKNADFFIDFYVFMKRPVKFVIPAEIFSASNLTLSFLQYIYGKTLDIGIIGNTSPKYSITFDDDCKYYYNTDAILIIKNPFLALMVLSPDDNSVYIMIYMKPMLIEEFNDYSIVQTTYDPNNDPSLKADDIVNLYFDSTTKTGIARNGVGINDDTDKFSYNLIRALLGTFKDDLIDNYYFRLDGQTGTIYPSVYSYMPLDSAPVCIYFPLFRPQLDSNGVSMTWPQYDPNDASTYVRDFSLRLTLNNNGDVTSYVLWMDYGNSSSGWTNYNYSGNGPMPSWRFSNCDFTLPFRFVGASSCSATDGWANNLINANYLFRIVKPTPTNTNDPIVYNIKGIGCEELTQEISNFSGYSATSVLEHGIETYVMEGTQRITFSEPGYPIDTISSTLGIAEIRNSKTCFVLFNESLVENASDFTSIYSAVTSALPNSIVCYIGSDAKIPSTHRNKVIHSNAIVTDLNTGETIPLVVKYIRYAERLYKLFNG